MPSPKKPGEQAQWDALLDEMGLGETAGSSPHERIVDTHVVRDLASKREVRDRTGEI